MREGLKVVSLPRSVIDVDGLGVGSMLRNNDKEGRVLGRIKKLSHSRSAWSKVWYDPEDRG